MTAAADITVIAPATGLPAAWWVDFDRRTHGGRDPLLLKGAWRKGWPDATEIDAVVRRIQASSGEGRRLRIYLDGERRNDLAARLLDTDLPRDRSVFEGMQRALSAERLAFIVNDVQDWSPAFTAAVGTFLSSMFEVRGLPPGGLEQILFAGNYAATPFGVHRGFEHAWLCHLGPASKDFYLWSPEDFLRLTGSLADVMDHRPLLPHGIRLVLEPGDALYLPAQWFHIGMQDRYSCSLAIGMYDQPLEHWLERTLVEQLRALQPWPKAQYARPGFDHDPLRAQLGRTLPRLERGVLDALDDHWYRLCSNAGFLCRHERWWPTAAPGPGDRVALHGPFRVCWRRREERLEVYLCHRRLQVVWHPAWPVIFQALDAGAVLSVAEIIAALADRWSVEDVLGVVRALAATGGLERVA